MTKEQASKIIKNAINEGRTAYFREVIYEEDMEEMLRYRMGFGEAETEVIIASLVLAGANFRPKIKDDANICCYRIYWEDEEISWGFVLVDDVEEAKARLTRAYKYDSVAIVSVDVFKDEDLTDREFYMSDFDRDGIYEIGGPLF